MLPVDVNTLASDALSLCALSPTVGRAATDLIDFDGNQLETLAARDFAPAEFGALQQRLSRVVVIGVLQQQGDGPSQRGLTLAPAADFPVTRAWHVPPGCRASHAEPTAHAARLHALVHAP